MTDQTTRPQMGDELLPCPFCGSKAELDENHGYYNAKGELRRQVAIFCTGCSANMCWPRDDFKGEDKENLVHGVVGEWNVRASLLQPTAQSSRWRHRKRGTCYQHIGLARVRSSIGSIHEGDELVIYRSESDGALWARPVPEFHDGRFEKVYEAAASTPAQSVLVESIAMPGCGAPFCKHVMAPHPNCHLCTEEMERAPSQPAPVAVDELRRLNNLLNSYWYDEDFDDCNPETMEDFDTPEQMLSYASKKINEIVASSPQPDRESERARPLAEWHEDFGPQLWWKFPIEEPPYAGTPLDQDWPGYHTHFTAIKIPHSLTEADNG